MKNRKYVVVEGKDSDKIVYQGDDVKAVEEVLRSHWDARIYSIEEGASQSYSLTVRSYPVGLGLRIPDSLSDKLEMSKSVLEALLQQLKPIE